MSGSFVGYLIGYIIAIIGVGYGLNAAGVGQEWITAAVLIMIGLGIVYAISNSQRNRPLHTSHTERVVDRERDPAQATTTRSYDRL